MAQVNVDLSEYDMLRESKNKAEAEVKELKAEIEEYKKNARVIVTTKKCYRVIDTHAAAKEAIQYYCSMNRYCSIYDSPEQREESEKIRLANAIEHAIRAIDTPECYHPVEDCLTRYESSTVIKGFEDVRLKVEETLKEEYKQALESKLAEAKASKEKYEEAYKGASAKAKQEVSAQYKFGIEELNNELKIAKCNLKSLSKQLEEDKETIQDLQDRLDKATTLNRKIDNYKRVACGFEKDNIELREKVKGLEIELEIAKKKLQYKPWYKRLF